MSTEQPLDILAFIADDRFGVTYKPRWNAVTGSMAASVLLQQIVYRWAHSGRRAFYKFARPCEHRLFRAGDSWEEELGMKRREFENARAAIAVRTRGEMAPDALVSYWIDAQRVTWYVLNEACFLQRFAVLYPRAGAGIQLPLPESIERLMDKTSISTNGRNVHQPPTELMDETCISSNASNVHLPMDETDIRTNGRNVHLLYSENKITQQKEPDTTAAAPDSAAPSTLPPAVAAETDPLASILDWIGFDDALSPKERTTLDQPLLLAWAYWVKLKAAEPRGRINNPVGLVRAQWRSGKQPRADLLRLARGWLALDVDARGRLLGRIEWSAEYGQYDPGDPLDDEFPNIPLSTAAAVYLATGGELSPPSLMPSVSRTNQSAKIQMEEIGGRLVRLTEPSSALWNEALAELEMQMTKATFTTWLKGTSAADTDDGIVVYVANSYAVEWLENRLHPLIQRTVDALAGRDLRVRYAVREREVSRS